MFGSSCYTFSNPEVLGRVMDYIGMVRSIEGKYAKITEDDINSLTKDGKKSKRNKALAIFSGLFILGAAGFVAYSDNPVDNSPEDSYNSPTGDILDKIPDNNAIGQTVKDFDNYVKKHVDTVKPVVEPVVEDKPVVDKREKVMTSEGEVYGIVDSWGGGLDVKIDGDGYPDYYRQMRGTWKVIFEDKGLLDVYEKYNIKNTVIEKFNTDGKKGYDNVKVFINGEENIPRSGVLVYDGVHVEDWGVFDYIGTCFKEKAFDLRPNEITNGCQITYKN